jgi:branched-chain amino acid transport system substrate-binding protein
MSVLRIGTTLSQSGIYARQGQQALQGVRLWVDETNAQGGLFVPELHHAVALQLIAYDDRSRRHDVEQLTERLISVDRVDFLIGPYSSGLAYAAATIAEAHQKTLWNHGGSSDAIMRQGFRWSVHLPTPASGYFGGLFSCLCSQGAATECVAIIQRPRGTFSTEVAAGVRQHAEQSGFPALPPFFYPADPDDSGQMSALGEELAAANPAVIIAIGRYEDDVALLRQLAETPLDAVVVAAVAAPMQEFRGDLQELADGCVGPSQWECRTQVSVDFGPSSATFVERFRQRFGQSPDYPAAQAYAAGLILQRCVILAETCSDAALRAAADTLVCRTFYGDFRLDVASGRQIGHETVLVQWQRDEKKVIWPVGVAEAGLIWPKSSARKSLKGESHTGSHLLPHEQEDARRGRDEDLP